MFDAPPPLPVFEDENGKRIKYSLLEALFMEHKVDVTYMPKGESEAVKARMIYVIVDNVMEGLTPSNGQRHPFKHRFADEPWFTNLKVYPLA
jgi:hypothetical protein